MNISYQSENFKKCFPYFEKVVPLECEIECTKTTKPMTFKEMMEEIKPEILTTNEFAYILEKELINKEDWYFAFVSDGFETCAVGAFWLDGGGWGVRAYGLGYDGRWRAGDQVISRKSLGNSAPLKLSPSETLTLEKRVIELEKFRDAMVEVLESIK